MTMTHDAPGAPSTRRLDRPSTPAAAASAPSGHRARPGLGSLQVLVGAALFGLGASVSKVALTAGLPPARLTAVRCAGAAVGLLLVLLLTGPARLRVRWRQLPLLAAVGLSGAALIQWFYFSALNHLPVGIALLLEFTAPLMIAVYSRVVLGHVVRTQVWWALGLTLLGLALVAQIGGGGRALDPVGVAAGLAAAVCLAAFYLLSKRALAQHHPLTVSFWTFALAAVFWAVVQPWWRFDASVLTEPASLLGAFADVSAPLWVPLVVLVLAGTLVPYALEVASLRHLTPTTTGIVGMSEPVVAAAVAWVWLGESLGAAQLAGAGLVLTGVILVQTVGTSGGMNDSKGDVHSW